MHDHLVALLVHAGRVAPEDHRQRLAAQPDAAQRPQVMVVERRGAHLDDREAGRRLGFGLVPDLEPPQRILAIDVYGESGEHRPHHARFRIPLTFQWKNARMTELRAAATRSMSAPPERVLEFLRDYHRRQSILTDQFRNYRVEEEGVGAGTVFFYAQHSPGRSHDFRLRVEDAEDGLVERDVESSFVSTWTVLPTATGSSVMLEGAWEGAGGMGGFFEKLFAPMSLRRTYGQVLDNLAAQVERQ